MDKQKKKNIKRIVALCCAVAVVLLLACLPLLTAGNDGKDGPEASILSGQVKTGTIAHDLIGGGTLSQEDAVSVSVPAEVKLTEFLVANGQTVQAGDAIARVDRVSVQEAVSYVQETLEYLAAQIEKTADSTLSGTVTAQAGGTVKLIYAKEGDSVQDVMLTHGALAVLSLDGRMSVTLETQAAIAAGDTVTVTLSDGTQVTGTVNSYLMGTAVILVKDKNYTPGTQVQLTAADGTALGTGTLEINSPWNATAYAGTVADIKASVGKSVDAGDTLMTLSDTGRTAQYQQLVDQHRVYEEMMLQLFQMYQTQLVTAPCDGVVSGIDKDSVQLLRSAGDGTLELLANAPNGDDTILYTNVVGKIAAVGTNGWAVSLDPQSVMIEDYKELSGVSIDTEKMTSVAVYDTAVAAPLYELQAGTWVQAELQSVQAGDVILFAGDAEGNFVWLVRLQKAQTELPSTPSQSTTSSVPSGGSTGQIQRPGASFPQQDTQEEEFTLYETQTAEIAAVIPQGTMTLEISVDEADILQVKAGQTANVTVDALTGRVFEGTVTAVSNTGTQNGGSSKFTVELTLSREADMLAGMNATATIQLESSQDVLSVPVAALVEQGTKTVIYTGYDEKTETLTDPVEVIVGISDGENAEICLGLNENDTYYYAYYDTLEISYTPQFGGFSGFGRG